MSRPVSFPAPSTNRCPDCDGLVTDDRCQACGLVLTGQRAATLWWIDGELHRLFGQRRAVVSQLRSASRAQAPSPPPPPGSPPPPPGSPPPPPGSTPSAAFPLTEPGSGAPSTQLQNLLLGLGAFLVAIAAIVFATVTWSRLSAALQGGVLVGLTAVAVLTTHACHRRQLRSTAEAVGVVAMVLALVDARALQVVAFPSVDGRLYWSAALAAVSAGCWAFGRVVPVRAAPVVAATLVQLSAPLLAGYADSSPDLLAATLVAQSAVVLAVLRRTHGPEPTLARPAAWPAGLGGPLAWFIGTMTALARTVEVPPAERWAPVATVVLAAAVAALVAWWGQARDGVRALALGTATGLGFLALLGGASIGTTGYSLALTVGASAVAGLAVGTRVPRRWGDPPSVVSGLAVAFSLPAIIPAVGPAVVGPLDALSRPWTGSGSDAARSAVTLADFPSSWTVAGFIAIGVAALLAVAHRLDRRLLAYLAAAEAAVIVALVPVLAGASVETEVATFLAAGTGAAGLAWWGRRGGGAPWVEPAWLLAGVCGALGGTWGLVAPETTVVAVATVAAVAGGLAVLGTTARDRAVALAATGLATTAGMAFGLVVVRAGGGEVGTGWVGLAVAAVAISAVAWGVDLIRVGAAHHGDDPEPTPPLASLIALIEALVILGFGWALLGLVADGTADQVSVGILAGTLALAAHAVRPGRRVLVGPALAGAVALAWQRLAVAGVETVEAYTVPAAAALLIAGLVHRARRPEESSWLTFGPGVLAALAPSTLLALGDPGLTRPLLTLAAAATAVLVGAAYRLQAPVAVGAGAIVVLGLQALIPVVGELPRWVSFGVAGVILLSVGATYEQRRRDVAGLRQRYGTLR